MENKEELWEKCIAFHGHACGGLMIGYKAALYAMELLDLNFSEDEDVVCVTENDACGVDAIQILLGCSAGKGNLLFRMRGKQAFTFFNRKTGKKVRLVLRPRSEMKCEDALVYMKEREPKELFDVKEPQFSLPERARIMKSIVCECCGEATSENMIRLEGGKKLCLDCYHPYSRFGL